jgi:hypothetical protein
LEEKGQYFEMGNEKFEDMAVLSTFAELRTGGALNGADVEALRRQLKTAWGRQVFSTLEHGEPLKPEDKSLLQRFSMAFAA